MQDPSQRLAIDGTETERTLGFEDVAGYENVVVRILRRRQIVCFVQEETKRIVNERNFIEDIRQK